MRELFVLNLCVWLAYSAVVLLVWWVVDECLDTAVVKLLGRRICTFQLGVGPQPGKLTAPLAPPEFAQKSLAVPTGP
jgi:hypothetical protein